MALALVFSDLEFDELLVLKFLFNLACQSYRLDKSIWKNLIPVFRTWNLNNYYLVHLGKVSPYLCFSMVTATYYVHLIMQLYNSRAFLIVTPASRYF